MTNDVFTGWRGALAAAVVMGHGAAASAQEVVGGWEGSSGRGYAFVSPSITLHRSEQFAWILRGAASYLYYDLPGAGGNTQVRSPGQSIGLGLRYAGPGFTATLGPGYEIRQTRRTLASGSVESEHQQGLTLEGNVFVQATPRTVISLLGSYGKANDYHWVRVGAKQQIAGFADGESTGWHLGVEGTDQGNEDVKSRQIGAVLEAAFPRTRSSLQLRAGSSRRENPDGSKESSPYFGVGYYQSF